MFRKSARYDHANYLLRYDRAVKELDRLKKLAGKLGMPADDAKIQDGFVKLAVQNARLGEWWIQLLIATEIALDEQMKKLSNDY